MCLRPAGCGATEAGPAGWTSRSTEELERLCATLGIESALSGGKARVLAQVQALAEWIARVPEPLAHYADRRRPAEYATKPGEPASVPEPGGPDDVIALDRLFSLATDCRNGHFAEHGIVSAEGDRVVRECRYCEPATRWSEHS
jgi:hypothetical protein